MAPRDGANVSDPTRADERVQSGASWNEFCDNLKNAGNVILSGPSDPLTRAEGFRYVSRLVRAGLEVFVENDDPLAPKLMRVVHETVKMGADNPDNYYQNACISGRYDYVIRGNRGSVHYLGLATQIGHYGQGRGMPPTGHIDGKELSLEPDGSFEIAMSCERPPGAKNWLPMTPETGTLIVRQSRLDPATEVLATMTIERLGAEVPRAPLTAQQIDAGLTSAGTLVAGASMIFQSWAQGFEQNGTNRLPRFDQALSNAFGGVPDIAYYHSYWKLGPGQALVIDAAPPPCDHFNFQLNNHWMESLDYRFHHIHVNSKTATWRDDGSVRVVVAHDDPGVPNWIETAGHTLGTMCWRWVKPADMDRAPEPHCRVVPVGEVASLPCDAVRAAR
jgi:hypothetical protein